MTRKCTWYDANNKEVVAVYACVQLRQWNELMPDVEPKFIKKTGYCFGYHTDSPNIKVRADRMVAFKTNEPSLHKCGARCRNAKGPNCECSCGGKSHGVNI